MTDGTAAAGAARAAAAPAVRFAFLDGYRALAALAVLAYHVLGFVRDRGGLTVADVVWLRLGNYGVSVFFLLSGFLLWRRYVVCHFDRVPPPPTGHYLLGRFLRIVPAYWVALAAFFFGFGLVHPDSFGSYVAYFGFTQTYSAATALGGLQVAWTLCIEISFYLALPALAWAVNQVGGQRHLDAGGRLRTQLGLLATLYATAVGWRLVVLLGSHDGPALLWLPAYLDWFALGMLLAVAHAWAARGGSLPGWVKALAGAPWLCWLFAAGIYGVSTQLGIPSGFRPASPAQTMGRFLLNGISALLLLLPGVLGDEQPVGLIRRLLGSRVLRWLGSISYGIYLWHTIWLRQVGRWVAAGQYPSSLPAVAAAVVVLTLATAAISFEMVEKPALHLRRSLARHRAEAQPEGVELAAAP